MFEATTPIAASGTDRVVGLVIEAVLLGLMPGPPPVKPLLLGV